MSETCTYTEQKTRVHDAPATHTPVWDIDRPSVVNVLAARAGTRLTPLFCFQHAGEVSTQLMAQWREHRKEPRRAS